MKINLLVLSQSLKEVKMPITQVIGLFTSLGYNVEHVNLLDYDFSLYSLQNLTKENLVVLAPFGEEECLEKIRAVFDDSYSGDYCQIFGGYVVGNLAKFGVVFDNRIGDFSSNEFRESLSEHIKPNGLVVFKLFTLNEDEVIGIAKGLGAAFGAEVAYSCLDGDMTLSFVSKNGNVSAIDAQSYAQFGDMIYCEDILSLDEALQEILGLVKMGVKVYDNTASGVVGEVLGANPIAGISVSFDAVLPEFGLLQAMLEAENLGLLLHVKDSTCGLELDFYNLTNAKREVFEVKNSGKIDKNVLKNYIFHNFLKKLRKNAW